MERKLIEIIGERLEALERPSIAEDLRSRYEEELETLARNFLPDGSGFDAGSQIDLDASNGRRVTILTGFHHMNDAGSYDGWTRHKVIATPAFVSFDLKVTGRDRNGIKDYIAEMFHHALGVEIETNWDKEGKQTVFRASPRDSRTGARAEISAP